MDVKEIDIFESIDMIADTKRSWEERKQLYETFCDVFEKELFPSFLLLSFTPKRDAIAVLKGTAMLAISDDEMVKDLKLEELKDHIKSLIEAVVMCKNHIEN